MLWVRRAVEVVGRLGRNAGRHVHRVHRVPMEMEVRVHRIYNLVPGACGGPPAGTRLVATVRCGDTQFKTVEAVVEDGEAVFDSAGVFRVTLFVRPDGSMDPKPLELRVNEMPGTSLEWEGMLCRTGHRYSVRSRRDPLVGLLKVDLADLVEAAGAVDVRDLPRQQKDQLRLKQKGREQEEQKQERVPATETASSSSPTRDEHGTSNPRAVLEALVEPLHKDGKRLLSHVQLTVAAMPCSPAVARLKL